MASMAPISSGPLPGSIVVDDGKGGRQKPSRVASPPNRFWTWIEGRAMFELASFYASRPFLSTLPKGDGHAVLTLPGFMATNNSTRPLRGLLTDLGYEAHGWDSGRNVRVNEELLTKLEAQLERLADVSGGKISLVGWSLGGVLARELAKLKPDHVRQVISLGSPISDDRGHTNAARLFKFFNGDEPEQLRDGQFQGLDVAPPCQQPQYSPKPMASSIGVAACKTRQRPTATQAKTSSFMPAIAD